jgi:predicted component of type VI protein secretion system
MAGRLYHSRPIQLRRREQSNANRCNYRGSGDSGRDVHRSVENDASRVFGTPMLKPHFSAEINFGHIMQAAVLLLTVGGGAVTSYISLKGDIETLRSDVEVRIASHELRIQAVEQAVEQRRIDDRDFQGETRTALSRIIDAIADLRTQVVQKQDRK